MDLYAVIGHPVAHSKSPQIHAAFARQTQQDLRYERILSQLDGFAGAVAAFRSAGGRGMNVTLPFKEEALAIADEASTRARTAGAANTLSFDSKGIHADNTDGVGLVRDIVLNHGYELKSRRILVMGAGGAARGVLAPLLAESPACLAVVNRTFAKAQALAQLFGVDPYTYADLSGRQFDLIINATSASLNNAVPPLPESLPADSVAYDMMYGESDTPFLAFARQNGARHCADGLGMLVEQAAESFYVWRGVRPATRAVLDEIRAGL